MKYNGSNVIGVNTGHSYEFEKMCNDLGACVYTPYKKFGYPTFTKDQCEEHAEFFYETTLRPSMMASTDYVLFGEPDCVFTKTIDRDVFDGSDIIIPSDKTPLKAMWAYTPFYDGFGNTSDERDYYINILIRRVEELCKHINLDLNRPGSKDMRFCLTANSIVKRDKIIQFYTKEKDSIIYLLKEITSAVDDIRPKIGINPVFSRYSINFSPDQMFSLIFGLYRFNWKINDNGHNCHYKDFKDENDLKIFLENNPKTEYIHACKIYYNK